MSSRIARALLIVFACFVFTAPSFAQGGGRRGRGDDQAPQAPVKWRGKAEVSGKVTDDTGKPVEARVSFVNVEVNSGYFVMSKKNGEFKGEDMKAGDWKVQIDAPNFIVWKQTVTLAEQKNPPLAVVVKRDNSPELLTKADALFKDGKNAEARAEYMKVLEAHPDLAGINRAIAFTYGQRRQPPRSAEISRPRDREQPGRCDAAAARGGQRDGRQRLSARDGLSRQDRRCLALRSRPIVNAAINMISKRQPANAMKLLDRAIARFPGGSRRLFLSRVRAAAGQYDRHCRRQSGSREVRRDGAADRAGDGAGEGPAL